MFETVSARIAVIAAALLLAGGGTALWLSAGDGQAQAARAPLPMAPAFPADLETPGPPPAVRTREEKRFARVDRDDDGRITQAEYLSLRKRNYDKLDVNGDGQVSFEEYAVKGIEKFGDADIDRDGALIPEEFVATAPPPRKATTAKAAPPCLPGEVA